MGLAVSAPVSRIVETVEDRFARLERETAFSGWDGPRSRAIVPAVWAVARDFARAATAEVPGLAAPFVSPGTDGSVHLRWSASGAMFDLELAGDGLFFAESKGGKLLSDGECTSLGDAIKRMRMLFR
jgi:hypothetical protein